MKHYVGYDADGTIISIHAFYGGWPARLDLTNPNSSEAQVQKLRSSMAKSRPEFVDFAAYDCPCLPDEGTCSCLMNVIRTKYVAGGVLTDKPALTVKIDGVVVDGSADDLLVKSPVVPLTVDFSGALPDGSKVTVGLQGAVMDPLPLHELVFSGGATPTLTLKTPAHGGTGVIQWAGPLVVPGRVRIAGFA